MDHGLSKKNSEMDDMDDDDLKIYYNNNYIVT